jgi:hypothetical protein
LPLIVSVVKVASDTYRVTWSLSVAVVTVTPDTAFLLGGGTPPDSATAVDPTHVDLVFGDGAFPPQSWSLTAQPNWLSTSVSVPQSGTTS